MAFPCWNLDKLMRNSVAYIFGRARRSQPCGYVVVFWLVPEEPLATATPRLYIHAQVLFRRLLKQSQKLQRSAWIGETQILDYKANPPRQILMFEENWTPSLFQVSYYVFRIRLQFVFLGMILLLHRRFWFC
jgi:hypothetical protein